jgi:pilus assembly protein CpaF
MQNLNVSMAESLKLNNQKAGVDVLTLMDISKKLVNSTDVDRMYKLSPSGRIECLYQSLKRIIESEKIIIGKENISFVLKQIYEELFEYGPISDLMRNEKITEVMINSWNDIYVETGGYIRKTDAAFNSMQHLRNTVEKIISPLGLRLDESIPYTDARLADGSRINVVIPPVAVNGMVVTIRKFNKDLLTAADLLKCGSINEKIAEFIKSCVKNRLNIIVSGASSTGKTTFLNVISNYIPDSERIITVEDTVELALKAKHVICLESRQANLEGRGEITLRDLIKNSLRMRPDRIIVGEIRGVEAIDVLQAMNTGHEGSLTTIHANSPHDLASRLETMLLMSAANLTPASAKRMIMSSIDMVIHLERKEEGSRTVACISEIVKKNDCNDRDVAIIIKDIFRAGFKDNKAEYIFTGNMPAFSGKINWRKKDFAD